MQQNAEASQQANYDKNKVCGRLSTNASHNSDKKSKNVAIQKHINLMKSEILCLRPGVNQYRKH